MVPVHPHSDASEPPHGGTRGGAHGGVYGGRLNLLISCASWRNDSWADRLPRLLEPMGIQSVRARSARQAEQVIRTVPVHIAVVDMGLPLEESRPDAEGNPNNNNEESGPRILELLKRLDSPPPTVIVKSHRGHRDECRHLNAALRCGVFAVVDRSTIDVEPMLKILQRCLFRFYEDRWPGGKQP